MNEYMMLFLFFDLWLLMMIFMAWNLNRLRRLGLI